jgi:hypothetical protein
MIRNILFASVVALGAAGASGARAQAPDTNGLAVPATAGNAVGGGSASIVGGGDNATILYSGGGAGTGGGALQAQPPRLARARNGYGSLSVDYLEPETASPGREAWMVGGGDNAQVVYGDPRR